MRTVARIIEVFGGLRQLALRPIRLDVSGFMPLCIEYLGTGPRGLPMVSVTHYYEQAGDLMSDPDMTFEVDGAAWLPVSFQQDSIGLYQEVVVQEGDRLVVDDRLDKALREFAAVWDTNLQSQGFLEEAERQSGNRR
ncbi:MAG: uncharacterized protein JWO38_7172 [Gemmataceae bacterium]|nr:uncharacterized protein [Gemmataceae bacterium]